MNVFKVRLGLATNSSSSHSIVLLDKPAKTTEERRFGWDYFVAASEQAKTNYLALCLYGGLEKCIGEDLANLVLMEWLGVDEELCSGADDYDYVDHQSVWGFPRGWGGKGYNVQFINELRKHLNDPRIAILGGNDNTDEIHPLLTEGKRVEWPLKRMNGDGYVARKDGDYWTIFNQLNGAKIRFSFDPQAEAPTRALVPELVDIKITDYCERECRWCYQSSSRSGKHANDIFNIARSLGDLRVFEVAIGGGEPTLHPDFVGILGNFRNCGVVPNFTTRRLDWLRDSRKAQQIMDLCGAVGYSVTCSEEILDFAALLRTSGFKSRRAAVHIIMGMDPAWRILDMLLTAKAVHLRVVLLGYKETGRGATYTYRTDKSAGLWEGIIALAERHECPNLSIDTVLAQRWQNELAEAGISPWLYETQDGRFSWYIDAVSRKQGPSSYCVPEQLVELAWEGYGFQDSIQRAFTNG